MSTESEFVRRIAEQFPVRPPVDIGIGDDGAVLRNRDGSQIVVVTDMLLDGVHFQLDRHSVALVGRKSIAVNLSDLAAMACRPTAAFVSIAVPRPLPSDDFLSGLYAGMESLADVFDFAIAGGDTNSWDGPFAINVCMTGSPFHDQAILRSGARPGDTLLVTGPLGGSLHADRHLTFTPRIALSEWLSQTAPIHAMMDISDGLAIDLHRMMTASGTGAILDATGIPIHSDVPAGQDPESRLQAALSDGEDFELLIAVAAESVAGLQKAASDVSSQPLCVVGHVTETTGCRIRHADDRLHDLPVSGWDHFG